MSVHQCPSVSISVHQCPSVVPFPPIAGFRIVRKQHQSPVWCRFRHRNRLLPQFWPIWSRRIGFQWSFGRFWSHRIGCHWGGRPLGEAEIGVCPNRGALVGGETGSDWSCGAFRGQGTRDRRSSGGRGERPMGLHGNQRTWPTVRMCPSAKGRWFADCHGWECAGSRHFPTHLRWCP